MGGSRVWLAHGASRRMKAQQEFTQRRGGAGYINLSTTFYTLCDIRDWASIISPHPRLCPAAPLRRCVMILMPVIAK